MGEQWILDIKSELKSTNPATEAEAWWKRSIYKVPKAFTRLNEKAYMPEMASFGPYHHGQPHLTPMEPHKRRALINFLARAQSSVEDIVETLRKEMRQLMDSYDGLDERWTEDENKFLELLILDGCFLLEIMLSELGGCNSSGESSSDDCSGESSKRYDEKDPVFSKQYITMVLGMDILKLENQLPLRVLSILASCSGGQIENIYDLILEFHYLKDEKEKFSTTEEPEGLHILDVYRRALLLRGEYSCGTTYLYRSAVELLEAGVWFRVSESRGFKDISFSKGVLAIPHVEINDYFEAVIRNLIAFEQIHGAGQEVTAYVAFMDGIINTAKDVALLREKGILEIIAGSDDNIADLFNCLTKEITIFFMYEVGVDVTKELSDYCSTRWPEWRANFVHTYLRNPWVFISLLGGFILLVLTVVQTVYTLLTYYSP